MKSFITKRLPSLYMTTIVAILLSASPLVSSFSGGDGTLTSPYQISSLKDITDLSDNVNKGADYANTYFNLTTGLNLDAHSHVPIGLGPQAPFRGIFDGNNNFITSYSVEGAYGYAGFFGYLGAGAQVRNLDLGGEVHITNGTADVYAGSVAGYAVGAALLSCRSRGTVSATSGKVAYAGGLVGHADSTRLSGLQAYESAEVSAVGAAGAFAAGIAAVVSGADEQPISGCANKGAVTAQSSAGFTMAAGVVGRSDVSLADCDNEGAITSTFGEYGFAAGIACYMTSAKSTISYAINEGAVTSTPYAGAAAAHEYSYAAGIACFFEKSGPSITAVHNAGNVTAHAASGLYLYVAGIVGGLEANATVAGAQNDGALTVVAETNSTRMYGTMGGLVADAESGCVIINGHNAGAVRAVSDAHYSVFIMGGVAGELLSGSVVRNSFNTGDVLSESKDPYTYEYIAGIAALVGAGSTIDNCYTLARIEWSLSATHVDLDVVGALAGSSEDTYITNSYWLYSHRYKPVARGICDNCASFDRYGVMVEDSMEPSFLYDVLNKRIENMTGYRAWVQGNDHPAEFDCKYFNNRAETCEAHGHCVIGDANACAYAPCDNFRYSTCGAQQCQRCDVELTCVDPSDPSELNESCTVCADFADKNECAAAGGGSKCQWCEIGGKCIGAGFRCKVFSGAGTEADPYNISTAEDLEKLRDAVEGGITFEHVYFRQTADIDLGGAIVNPIGDEARQFRGTYDGQRHKISGYTVRGQHKHAGFFGYLGYEGLITNLRVNGTVTTTMYGQHAYAGGVVGLAYANVVNCRNYGDVSATSHGGYAYAGGIVGYAEFGAVTKTINTGKIYAESFNGESNTDAFTYVGGVAGYLVSDFYLEKCFNFGEVLGRGNSTFTRIYAGGIAGYINHDNYVVNSLNLGNVRAEGHPDNTGIVRASAGGIAGECEYNNYVMNFGSHGNVTVVNNLTSDKTYTATVVGGFFGSTSNGNIIENSYATGFIYAWTPNSEDHDYSAIGGLIGIAIRSSTFRNCYFSGDVVLDTYLSNYYSYAGALVGYSTYDVIENCYWRFDPELDSFGAGACTNCHSFDKYDVVAEDTPDPRFLYQVLNSFIDPAEGNHTSKLPAVEFARWVQGFSHELPAGFECSNFNTAEAFCEGAEYCRWAPSTEPSPVGDDEGVCEYRPCADFSYETCNAPQCHACDFSRVCIDADDNKTTCISCSVNTEEYTCEAIPVCNWCRVTQECVSDTHMCVGFDGNGTAESPYIVRSTYDLWTIQKNVNSGVSYEGRYFKLINNLFLDGQEVEPIGTASNPFRGSFDGQGHVVYGYTITGSDHAYVGFFGYVGEGGSVLNFRVNGTMSVSSRYYDVFAGGVAGYAYRATIAGCHNYGKVRSHSATGFSYAGGIVGYSENSNITGCFNTAPVTATGLNTDCYAGGIVGDSESDFPITHCFNDASIDTAISSRYRSSHVGGIAGTAKNVVNCFNKGRIIVTADSDSFTFNGGIVGVAASLGYVRNCYSTGDIYVQTNKTSTYSYTGGIVGSTYGAEVHNCYTEGVIRDLSTSATVGAVVGNAYQAANISRCFYPSAGNRNATGVNTTCTECSPFLADGKLVILGNVQVAVALNSTVTPENGYVHWVKPAEINQTAAFECGYFSSVTSDACTSSRYCSWCFITAECAPLGTCHECAEMTSLSQCNVYKNACAWCKDENACKVIDSECTKCSVLDNVTCDTNQFCHHCGDEKGCLSVYEKCFDDDDDHKTMIIIVACTLAAVVLLVIALVVAIFACSCCYCGGVGANKYKQVGDADRDEGFSRGQAPLLINDEAMAVAPVPHYVSQGYANPADFAKTPREVSAQNIAADESAAWLTLNSALREAGFTETQTATLMAAALDKAASAAAAGGELSQEEAMALAILAYDLEEGELAGDDNPFNLINAALRDGTEQGVAPVKGIVALIMKALGKLTPVRDATVYHGMTTKFLFEKNTVLSWPEFMCTCGSIEAVKEAMKSDGKVTGTIFTVSNAMGYDLQNYSFSKGLQEIFLSPGAKFKVVDFSSSLDLNIINLEMI